MQCCSLQHQNLLLSPVTSTTRWCFLLWLWLFILSGIISPLISSSILGTYWPGEFIFKCLIFLPFHTVHGALKARILTWFAIPFSSGPHFIRTLTMICPSWVALHGKAYSFIELDKAVVHVISLISFLDCGIGKLPYVRKQRTKEPLMKVKEDSEKVDLNLNIQKTKLMASSPGTSWQIDGKQWKHWETILGGLQNRCRWWLQPWH